MTKPENRVSSFEDLEVFQRAYRVSLELHRESLRFPKIEQYALADQLRRASKSICANIAEGFAKQRRSSAEYRRYLLMAIGSATRCVFGSDIAWTCITSMTRHRRGGGKNTSSSQRCCKSSTRAGPRVRRPDARLLFTDP